MYLFSLRNGPWKSYDDQSSHLSCYFIWPTKANHFAVFYYIHSRVGTVADLGLYREGHPRRKVSLSQIPEKGKMVGHVLGWKCQFKKGRNYSFQAGCKEGFQWKGKQVQPKVISEPFMLIKRFLIEIMAFSKVSMVSFARLACPAEKAAYCSTVYTVHCTTTERKDLSVRPARCGESDNSSLQMARASRCSVFLLFA